MYLLLITGSPSQACVHTDEKRLPYLKEHKSTLVFSSSDKDSSVYTTRKFGEMHGSCFSSYNNDSYTKLHKLWYNFVMLSTFFIIKDVQIRNSRNPEGDKCPVWDKWHIQKHLLCPLLTYKVHVHLKNICLRDYLIYLQLLAFFCFEFQVETDEELQVLSVLPSDGSQCCPGNQYSVMLLPSTMVTYIACRYRFVLVLDLSPSVSTVVSCFEKV